MTDSGHAWQAEWALKANLLRRNLGPVAWALAFRQLAETRGVQLGQGARNDRTSDSVAEVGPSSRDTAASVAALAIEIGVSPRTARRRLRLADALADYPDVACKLDRGEIDAGRAEELVRDERIASLRQLKVPAQIVGPAYELRIGDLREVWADVPDCSIDAAVVDPPYSQQFIPLFEDVASLLARVLKPGRLAAIYCGHMSFPEEIRLLEAGSLTYVWHGVNLLPGRHSRIHGRMVNGKHRSVVLLSAGPFTPRRWIHDTFFAEGRGGPDTRPLHPWQQAVEPMQHWVRMTSEPGETVFDPCCGSGTTGVAALMEGRHFLGGDLDPAYVETTRRRLEEPAAERENNGAGA